MSDEYLTKVLQNPDELQWFIDLLKTEGVKSYLEIGSRWGGSLWRIANALPRGSRVVAVDLPAGPEYTASLKACITQLKRRGYEAHLILGNSMEGDVIRSVWKFGEFDACLIDADHSLRGVTADWKNYGPNSRLVAFHDISWSRGPDFASYKRIEVPAFWSQIKNGYRYVEQKLEPRDNGLGVLWRS